MSDTQVTSGVVTLFTLAKSRGLASRAWMTCAGEVVMVNVLGFRGSAPEQSTPGCIAGNAAARRRLLHARRGTAPPRDPRASSPSGPTRAVDGTAVPPP